ncbi:MAG: nucleotidyltransferase family protein [Pseudomonadota bacterium]
MKAIILAAGRGERMRPLTDNCPKPLLKVANKALIEYHLIALQKSGITEVVINHAWLGSKIEHFLASGQQYGLSICYSAEQQALETAGGIIQALPLLTSKGSLQERFLVVNGDIFTDYNFKLLLAQKLTSKAHLIMVNNPDHHPEGDFCLSNGRIIEEKLNKMNVNKYTFSGIGIYQASFFDGLTTGKRALAPLLRQAIKAGDVSGELYQGLWTDVGTPQRLQQLDDQLTALNQ